MEVFEHYKNLFFHPADFANDKLTDGWPWWAYALIVVGVNLLLLLPQILVSFFGKMGMVTLAIVALSVISPFLFILIINAPFKTKHVTWGEVFQVNFAYSAYSLPIYGILSLLYLLFVGIGFLTSVWILVIFGTILFLLFTVVIVWLMISYVKILAELHSTSAWMVFGWIVLLSFIAFIIFGVIYGFALNAMFGGMQEPQPKHLRAKDVLSKIELSPKTTEAELQAVIAECDAVPVEDWLCRIQVAEKISMWDHQRALRLCSESFENQSSSYGECVQRVAEAISASNPDVALEACKVSDDAVLCLADIAYVIFESGQSTASLIEKLQKNCPPEIVNGELLPFPRSCFERAGYVFARKGKIDDALAFCDAIPSDNEWVLDGKNMCYVGVSNQVEDTGRALEICNILGGASSTKDRCLIQVAENIAKRNDAIAIELCRQAWQPELCIAGVRPNFFSNGRIDLAEQACDILEGGYRDDCLRSNEFDLKRKECEKLHDEEYTECFRALYASIG